ncbi:MAG: glycosyltransferase family 39 protein [Acidobacteriota bacterium]
MTGESEGLRPSNREPSKHEPSTRKPSRSQLWPALALGLLSLGYFAATLPYLGDYPLLDWPQMGIAAPAHKLAAEGVYGNDLFAGYHRSEQRNYEYMPAYPLLVALSYKLFGLGVWQARLVSVLCGWLALLLTFQLGRLLYGVRAGVLAATLLATLRLGLIPGTTGVAVIDFARVIRYDILVPVFVLASCCCLVWAVQKSTVQESAVQRSSELGLTALTTPMLGYLASGLLAGLAALAHVYGAFVLVPLAGVLFWHHGLRMFRSLPVYLLAAGFVLALLPWIGYVLQDPEAYAGQMSRHQGRFDLLDPSFYWHNLQREVWRYAAWSGGSLEAAFLQPRVGIWLVLLLVPVSSFLLWRRTTVGEQQAARVFSDRFLLLALPSLALCLALLVALKRYYYTILVWPFLALQLAFLADRMWRGGRAMRYLVGVVLVLLLAESGAGVLAMHQKARSVTRYEAISSAIAAELPAGGKGLISQPYWLGLTRHGYRDLRSVNLVFLQPPSTPVAEIMRQLAPDWVVIESYYFERDATDPRASPGNEPVRRRFLELGEYLASQCRGRRVEPPSPDYGSVEVYDCRSAT